MVAPGTAVREGLDNIVQGGTGALICIGESEELNYCCPGGVKLEVDYTPAMLYQLAKMDPARLSSPLTAPRSCGPTSSSLPDPHDPVARDRHSEPHRGARLQADRRPRIAISASRSVVSLYLDGAKYILDDIPWCSPRPTRRSPRSTSTATSWTRSPPVSPSSSRAASPLRRAYRAAARRARHAMAGDRALHRRAGRRGRLIEMQLEETMVGVAADKSALVRDYTSSPLRRASPWSLTRWLVCRAGPPGLRPPRWAL